MVEGWKFDCIFYDTTSTKEKVGDEAWQAGKSLAMKGNRAPLKFLEKRVTGSDLHVRMTIVAVV